MPYLVGLAPVSGAQVALVIDNTAGGIALTVPATATHAIITNDTASGVGTVRWLDDGTTVTAANGQPLAAGDTLELTDLQKDFRAMLLALKFIRVGADNGSLMVTYYKAN